MGSIFYTLPFSGPFALLQLQRVSAYWSVGMSIATKIDEVIVENSSA